MILLASITKQHGAAILSRNAGFHVLPNTSTGLAGPNDAGYFSQETD